MKKQKLTLAAAIVRTAIVNGLVDSPLVVAAYDSIPRRDDSRPYRPRTMRLPKSRRTSGPGHAS